MRQLRDYQIEACEAITSAWTDGMLRPAIVLPTGVGKGHPHDTVIPTPSGLRKFGALDEGDEVYGVDGRPARVTGVFERGMLPVYRVRFTDGTSVLVDADHRWEVKRTKRLPRVLSTAALAAGDLRESDGRGWRWAIPTGAAPQRPDVELSVPPYTLGALIANGHLHGRGAPVLTTPDHDVVALIKAEHVEVRERPIGEPYCPRWALPGLQGLIRAMGLGVPSGEKFIPAEYVERASVAQRTALLRGLMDGDGSSRTGGRRSAQYHTTSPTLARDVQRLIWSLGGTAQITEPASCLLVSILTPSWLYPFGTIRKAQADRPRRTLEPRRAIVAIEPEGMRPIRCITVDGPRSLYLIGREHIVTHNTDVIAKIATDAAGAGRRVLAIAHRSELLDQITARCHMHAPGIPVGRVQAARNEFRRPITVAMAPTLAGEKRRARLPRPDLVIIDECHHAASTSQMSILRWAGSFDHTPTMGVTATMTRGDRRGLGDVWQDVVYQRSIKWAIDSGWLVEPRGRAVVTDHLDLDAAKVSRGDYQDGELGEMVAQDVDQIVKAWCEHASQRLTVAFTPNVSSAQQLAEEFRAAGVPTGEVYGSTPHAERAQVYADLAAGRIRVLVSVMVTTEGWDSPKVSCILMARPTRLPGLYQQIIGRGLRTTPGKTDCLVLDVVGASRFQKLVTLVDLHETAEYNTDELDDLPCPCCVGSTEPCKTCPCHDENDGGAPLEELRRRLIGPASYEDLDMFAGSGLNWLFTRGGLRFLPAGDRMAVLWPDSNRVEQGAAGAYLSGHCTVRGYDGERGYIGRDGQWLDAGALHPLGPARELAEAWALAYDPSVASRSASWRRRGGAPSQAQVEFAARLGVTAPETMTKGRLSDEISIALASKVLDR